MANTRYEDDNNSSGTSNRGFASMILKESEK